MASTGPAFSWDAKRLREVEDNFRDESSSRWMYATLADCDSDQRRASLFRNLAEYEETHAGLWARLLRSLGRGTPPAARFWEHRILVAVARVVGVGAVLPILHKGEVDGISKYKRQAEEWKDPRAQETLRTLLPDEVVHEVDIFGTMRDVGSGRGSLRSAILGANDGLGSILALAAGVAGATSSSPAVLIAGFAGLVAGSVSMSASNYVSVKAEQEVYASQVRLAREAIESAPGTKREQLKAAYRGKGLTEAEAEALVSRLAERPEEFLRAVLAEERGIGDESYERPARLSAYTGLAFAGAGLLPILPFLFLPALPAVFTSVAVTAVALFFAGVFRALTTLHSFLKSGLEMIAVGMGAAAATYLVGLLVGGVVA